MEVEKLNSEFTNDLLLNRDSLLKIGRTLFKKILETTSSQSKITKYKILKNFLHHNLIFI
jgi:hypothetical protein